MTALLEKAVETVLAQAALLPDAQQDAIALKLQQTLTEWTQEQPLPPDDQKPRPQFGSARGMGYMTADFEAPLDEFKEYTE